MSQHEINPIEDWESEELSEEELDALAGGRRLSRTLSSASSPTLDNPFLVGDVQIRANIDSSYTSYFGSTGTTSSIPPISIPFNITQAFP
jgi:hypothetical protein